MADFVSAFQLGTSTVVTLPKKLGIKPGQKLEVKKAKNGLTLKLNKKINLADVLRRTQGAWAGGSDWEEYQKRRKFELEASKKRREAWQF